jgi:hypothetical protein
MISFDIAYLSYLFVSSEGGRPDTDSFGRFKANICS